ncbi:MAG: DUF2924 domain-containing protein [Armatimonadota bacterium]
MKDSVKKQIADLQNLSYDELKQLWRTLYGSDPPAYNKVFIKNRLAYRIQELTYGGLSNRARQFLKSVLIANGFKDNGCRSAAGRKELRHRCEDLPVLGTKLTREWNGRRHEAIVVTGGFEYDGKRYRSLTAVAKAITGTHRSGRAFFGFKADRDRRSCSR